MVVPVVEQMLQLILEEVDKAVQTGVLEAEIHFMEKEEIMVKAIPQEILGNLQGNEMPVVEAADAERVQVGLQTTQKVQGQAHFPEAGMEEEALMMETAVMALS